MLAGAASAASAGWLATPLRASAACLLDEDLTLNPARRGVYVAVVESLGLSQQSPVKQDDWRDANDWLATLVDEYGPEAEGYLSLLLDEVRVRDRPDFQQLRPTDRLGRLRDWSGRTHPRAAATGTAHLTIADDVRRAMLRDGGPRTDPRPRAEHPHAQPPARVSTAPPPRWQLNRALFSEAVIWAELPRQTEPAMRGLPDVVWR